MNRHPLAIACLLVVSLLCGLGAYLYLNATAYQEVIEHGPSPEARINPYLAAELFLRERGLDVKHTDRLEPLPTGGSRRQSLLLLGDRTNMTPHQVEQVLDWVKSGASLVFVAQALWDEKTGKSGDLLLDRLQLRQSLSQDLTALPSLQNHDPHPKLTKLYLEDEEAPAYIGFNTDFHLEDPNNLARSWANSALATHMLQLSYGHGSVTVITDADIWKTQNIGQYDNAWLLWYLNADSAVTLLFSTDHDNLWSLLLRYFPQALAALGALIGLWLWHVGARHGPLQAPPAKARRQLQEHLRASADFLLRHNGQGVLLQALQQDILRRARRRHPGFERLDAAGQWQVLECLTQQPTSAIRQALQQPPRQRLSSADFSRLVAHLQSLRNAL